jgi:hypothetical protein
LFKAIKLHYWKLITRKHLMQDMTWQSLLSSSEHQSISTLTESQSSVFGTPALPGTAATTSWVF